MKEHLMKFVQRTSTHVISAPTAARVEQIKRKYNVQHVTLDFAIEPAYGREWAEAEIAVSWTPETAEWAATEAAATLEEDVKNKP